MHYPSTTTLAHSTLIHYTASTSWHHETRWKHLHHQRCCRVSWYSSWRLVSICASDLCTSDLCNIIGNKVLMIDWSKAELCCFIFIPHVHPIWLHVYSVHSIYIMNHSAYTSCKLNPNLVLSFRRSITWLHLRKFRHRYRRASTRDRRRCPSHSLIP